MPDPSTDSAPRNPQLQEVLLAYLRAVDAGTPQNREDLLRRHPDLAEDLRTFFADQDRLDRLAAPLRREREPGSLGRVPYFGDYELIEEIARGGMGVVYKARQNSLQRVVALKMIRAGALATPDELERFRKESQEAAGLDHPNIVPVYEVGSHEGQAYFTMKLFPDGNLAAHLPRLREQPREAVRILSAVARAIDHAHRHGVLHRDLKPANILLDVRNQPHVTDFGLAKRVAGDSGVTQSGLIVGTPSYMAPEQAAGKGSRLTPAIDVYALGAILYELLTGRPPFRAETPLGTLMQVIGEEPARPRQLNRKADRVLELICLKCLEKDPARRYGSAARLADDLERWLNGEPVSVRRGWWPRSRWARPRLSCAAVLLIVVGLFAVLGLLGSISFATVAARQREMALMAMEEARYAEHLAREREERSREHAERLLYFQRLALAQREWEENKPEKVLQLLDQARDLRGWEWQYLRRQVRGNRFKLEAIKPIPNDEVRDVAFAPDGQRLATAHQNGQIRLWDASSGKLVKEYPPAKAAPTRVRFSPDGQRLAVGDMDGRITVRNQAGAEVLTFRAHKTQVTHLLYSPDGRFLATTGVEEKGSSTYLWDALSGTEVAKLSRGAAAVDDMAFSPDATKIATGHGDGWLRVWSVPDGRELISQKERGVIESVAWSPDGQRLAVGASDRVVRLYETKRWQVVSQLPPQQTATMVMTFSPDGLRLATLGGDGAVKLWSVSEGVELLTLGSGKVCLVFSPDNRLLATVGKDGSVQVWDATPEVEKPGTMKKAD